MLIRPSFNAAIGTTSKFASRALLYPWTSPGGDWIDRDGIANGPNPTAQTAGLGNGVDVLHTLDVGRIAANDILIRGASYVSDVRIDGAPASAFWTDPSSNSAIAMPSKGGLNPIFVQRGDNAGAKLTFLARYTQKTVSADAVALHDLQPQPYVARDDTSAPDAWTLPLIDEATLLAFLGKGGYGVPWAFNPQFGVDPSYGFPYLRFSSCTTAATELILTWFAFFAASDVAYCRYLLMVESDVWDGMTELGMKLPGLRCSKTNVETISWRMWHGPVDPANKGVFRLDDYRYDAAMGGGWPVQLNPSAWLFANRWHVIEQGARMNTPGVSDGRLEARLDGHTVALDAAKLWRTALTSQWDDLHVNVYHGGQGKYPSQPIHYRIALVSVSKRGFIGVPSVLLQPGDVSMADAQSVATKTRAADDEAQTVAGNPTASQQIGALQAQVTALQGQLTQAAQDLTTLKANINAKLDALATDDVNADQHRADLRSLVA